MIITYIYNKKKPERRIQGNVHSVYVYIYMIMFIVCMRINALTFKANEQKPSVFNRLYTLRIYMYRVKKNLLRSFCTGMLRYASIFVCCICSEVNEYACVSSICFCFFHSSSYSLQKNSQAQIKKNLHYVMQLDSSFFFFFSTRSFVVHSPLFVCATILKPNIPVSYFFLSSWKIDLSHFFFYNRQA